MNTVSSRIPTGVRWKHFPKALKLPLTVEAVEAFASKFGTVSRRDGGIGAWPIKPRKSTGTFSEVSGEARFHTDAQYHDNPERAFILACERPASDGGVNLVLNAEDAKAVALEAVGVEGLAMLEQNIWSWRIPTVFQSSGIPNQSSKSAVFRADGTVRWRLDNLVTDNFEQAEVACRLSDALEKTPLAARLLLEPGDVFFCDNWFALHARTDFNDPERLLYRVRLK